MAWRSHGDHSNKSLVDALVRNGLLTNKRAMTAMLSVDRANYCRPDSEFYQDCPQPIGFGATISAPHMHAHCLQLLEKNLFVGAKVLDVGSGSGYLLALFSEMVCATDTTETRPLVYGIEHIPELTTWSINNLKKSSRSAQFLELGVINVVTGDGRLGLSSMAPFDAIHVGAASPTTPQALIDQLSLGGRLIIPVGKEEQDRVAYDRDAITGLVTKTILFGVRYVPLTDKESQIKSEQRSFLS